MVDIMTFIHGEVNKVHAADSMTQARKIADNEVLRCLKQRQPWDVRILRGPEKIWNDSSRRRANGVHPSQLELPMEGLDR